MWPNIKSDLVDLRWAIEDIISRDTSSERAKIKARILVMRLISEAFEPYKLDVQTCANCSRLKPRKNEDHPAQEHLECERHLSIKYNADDEGNSKFTTCGYWYEVNHVK